MGIRGIGRVDRRRRPKKKGGRCQDAAAPGQPLILRPQIGLGRIEALLGVGGVRMASRRNHRGRKGAFAPVCRCLRSERQRLGVVFSDFPIRPDGKLFCWSLFGPLVPGRPKKTRQRAGSWFVRCRGGLTGLEVESHGPLTPVPVLRLRRSAARPTRSPRHLSDHKLRSLRRHTYTVRPQVQQVTVFLIIVTPSNAKSALTEHLGLENCGARINPDPRPSSPIPGNVRLSVSTRCSM